MRDALHHGCDRGGDDDLRAGYQGAVLASAGATWLVEGVGFVARHLHIAVHSR